MKVILVFPPHWVVHSPPLAPALLASALRDSGHEVVVRDLNLETFRRLLSKEWMDSARRKAEAFLSETANKKTLTREEKKKQRIIDSRLPAFPFMVEHALDSFQAMTTGEAHFDIRETERHWNLLNLALQLSLIAHFPATMSLESLSLPSSPFSTRQILEACRDRTVNPFIEFFERYFLEELAASDAGLLGLSICSHEQVIPGLTLARLIKERCKDMHICVGGSFFTKAADQLNADLFRWIDSIIIHEGEEALVALCGRLNQSAGRPLTAKDIPNCITPNETGGLVRGPVEPLTDLDRYPDPDFDDYDLEAYLSPEPAIPVLSSRGCYFARCAFCASPSILISKYASVSAARFVSGIVRLHRQYGHRFFTFMDEALSPVFLKGFCEEILAAKADGRLGEVYFTGEIRLEKAFADASFVSRLHQAGFRKVLIGLESCEERIQRLIGKRIDLEAGMDGLNTLIAEHISVHLFFVTGFPTESRQEFEASLERIVRDSAIMKDPLFSFAFHPFELETGSLVCRRPEDYGITEMSKDPEKDLLFHLQYSGIEPHEEERRERTHFATSAMFATLGRDLHLNPYHSMFHSAHYEETGIGTEEMVDIFTDSARRRYLEKQPSTFGDDTLLRTEPGLHVHPRGGVPFVFNSATAAFGKLSDIEQRICRLASNGPLRVDELIRRMQEGISGQPTPRPMILYSLQSLLDQRHLLMAAAGKEDSDRAGV